MTIELSVSDVRDALVREAGLEPGGGPALRTLGRVFQQTFAGLVSDDPLRGGLRFVYEASDDAEGKQRLLEHAYATSVGPWLTREQSRLQAESGQVLFFWSAVRALTEWLYDLVSSLRASGEGPARWQDAARALRAEVRLACELREPGWSGPVRLTGVADAFVDVRRGRRPCVVELKLGGHRPAVDLGQAALYRLLAQRANPGGAAAAVALVRFSPGVEEVLFEAPAMAEAEATLLGVIGRLAGVDRSQSDVPASTGGRPGGRGAAEAGDSPLIELVSMLAEKVPPTSPSPGEASTPRTMTGPRLPAPAEAPVPTVASPYAELGDRLQRALREYVPDVQIVGPPVVGSRFVRYEIGLGRGGKVNKVKAASEDVGVRLKLAREPIVMQAGGRLTIDIGRDDPETLPFATIRSELESLRVPGGSSCLPVGVDLAGKLHLADLADPSSAHALVAGTTGSGKTEWLRTAIAGLLLTNTPETLRLVLIDPKRVAFSDLRRSPFLWNASSFWDNGGGDVVELLEALASEMDRRYGLLAKAGVDHLLEYNRQASAPMYRLVCFCDEYFALLAQGDGAQGKEVKRLVGVLGAKGRAAGVHLILATQQPSRQVVSGPIDANIPCRVGLMMANAIDSRMIIQTAGAEKLTGRGDLLYKSIGDPVRLQSPYLTSDDRARIFGAR